MRQHMFVVFKTLPKEARNGDAMNFPIFVLEDDVYMENIILEINSKSKIHSESIKAPISESSS